MSARMYFFLFFSPFLGGFVVWVWLTFMQTTCVGEEAFP